MLALATTIGDRIHRELAVYGANIVVYPKADTLSVNVAGVDMKPATGGAYLRESDLAKLKTIFWANNITGVSPELPMKLTLLSSGLQAQEVDSIGLWFDHPFGNGGGKTGAPQLHPSWKVRGAWPNSLNEVAVGQGLAQQLHLSVGNTIRVARLDSLEEALANSQRMVERHMEQSLVVSGIVDTGSVQDQMALLPLAIAQQLAGSPDAMSRVEISARTKPEDAFARKDPDTLSPAQHEIWYCRPYANSIAYQIQEAIPGARAEQVRRVEQSEGTVLSRISGLMWLVSAAALLAAGFAVSAAMATAVLERRREIGLMRSLGASKGSIALLFYAETGLLAVVAGIAGYLAGSLLAFWLGGRIFTGDAAGPVLNFVLLPVIVAMALIVAVAGSTPSIRTALRMDPSGVLRGDN